jgi:hypothetical protein
MFLHHQRAVGVQICETENNRTNLSESDCEDVKWNELSHDHISQLELVFKVLGILVLVSGNEFV